MQQPKFVNNEIYHVYNRGVDKREIFLNDSNYLRFIHDLFEFNDTAPAAQFLEVRLPKIGRKPRKLLVEILAFCLMPNHFHLLLRQKIDVGITEFMRKIGTGYTNYFNSENERVGSLFQGKFKAVHVSQEHHLRYLPHYIHLNPLDLYAPEWRKGRIANLQSVLKFLESYRWSSYLDYVGRKNFPSVTQRDFLLSLFGSPTSKYYKAVEEWLGDMDVAVINDVALD